VVGGLLVAASWRWVFYVNVPVGLAAIAIGWRRLPLVPGQPVKTPDAVAATLVTAGIALLSLGLVEGNDWGWGSGRVIAALAGSVVLLGAFVVRIRRHHNPLIEPSLFRIATFRGASIVALTFSIAFGAMLLSIVLWMQDVWGWSALRTGLAFAPGPLMVPLFGMLITGRLIGRFGPGRVIAAGASIYGIGVAWWALRAGLHPNYLGQVLPGTICTGIGVGLTLPTFMATGASSLPPESFTTGSAVVNMLRQVGLAVGVSVFVAVVGTPGSPVSSVSAFRDGWEVIAAIAFAAAAVGLFALRARGPATVATVNATVSPATQPAFSAD
jgi:MFS family permease